jgi:hypothetical protein
MKLAGIDQKENESHDHKHAPEANKEHSIPFPHPSRVNRLYRPDPEAVVEKLSLFIARSVGGGAEALPIEEDGNQQTTQKGDQAAQQCTPRSSVVAPITLYLRLRATDSLSTLGLAC